MKPVILFLIIFFTHTPTASAQLKISKFFSNSKDDWVEIFNESDSEINFKDYFIEDLAGNKIQKEIILPPKSNCIFDFGNRLNNGGDIIYLKKEGSQLDCVKYGEPENGECANSRSSEGNEAKPVESCYEKVVETPKPSTPAPTVLLTPKPTQEKLVLAATSTPTLSFSGSTREPIQNNTDPVVQRDDGSEEEIVINTEDNNFLSLGSLVSGLSLVTGSIAFIVKKEYNERHLS